MQPKMLKYILDIESVIVEIEYIKKISCNDFSKFTDNIVLQRAIERDLEIIGESIRKLLEIMPGIKISSTKKIIGLRNIIAHAYDSVDVELLWAIIQRDIPILSLEIQQIKSTY